MTRRPELTLPLAVLTLALLLPLTAFLVTTFLLNWSLQAVRSASMEPTYPVGSLLVVSPIDASEVRPGMAMTFADPVRPGRLVSHRVLHRAPGPEMAFITRGDANASADPVPVPAHMVRGRVRWHVPYLGDALRWLLWPRGFLVLVVLPALILIVGEVKQHRRLDRVSAPLVDKQRDRPAVNTAGGWPSP